MVDYPPPAPPPLVPPPPEAAQPAPPSGPSWRTVFIVAVLIAAIFVIRVAVTNSRADKAADHTATASRSATTSAAAASSAPAATASAAEESSGDASPSVADSTAGQPASPPGKKDPIDFVMPNYVGTGLQNAQNDVQKHGIFFSRSHDMRGSRRQVLDRNWQVCDQQPAAGQRVHGSRTSLEGRVDFGVVRTSEKCP